MRTVTYKVLTTLIILLNILRKKVMPVPKMVLRKERDEQNLIQGYWFSKHRGILLECCDCGLSHRLFESEKGAHAWPERPEGYDYKWRFGK